MRNIILSLVFFNIFIPCSAMGQSIDNITQDYFVSGVVYLDENQNGIFDSLESGIGGVAIKYGENQIVRTDPRGRFEIQFQTKREFERLVVDPNTLPAGADFTSPPQLILNRSRGLKRKVDFGIYYQPKTIKLDPIHPNYSSDSQALDPSQFSIFVDESKVKINGEETGSLIQSENNLLLNQFELNFRLSPTLFNQEDLSKVLNVIKRNLEKIDHLQINLQMNEINRSNRRSVKNLLDDLRIKFMEQGLDKKLVRTKQQLVKEIEKDSLKISIFYKEDYSKCNLQISNNTYQFRLGEVHTIEATKFPNVRAYLICPHGKLTFISPWNDIKNKKQNLRLSHSPFIEKSRDLNIFLNLKSEAQFIKVNKERLDPIKEGAYHYIYRGKEGVNKLEIKEIYDEDKAVNYKYTFGLYSGHKHLLRFNSIYSSKSSKSDAFNSKYEIDRINQYELSYAYKSSKLWEYVFSYRMDIRQNKIRGLAGDTVKAKHKEYYGLLGKTFRFQPNKYQSIKYALYLGVLHKTFNPGDLSAVFFPKDFTKPLVRADIIFPEVFKEQLDIRLFAEYAGLGNFDKYFYRYSIETHLWLNRLGRLINVDSTYIYYDRYKYFDHLKLVLGISNEQLVYDTKNFSNSKTTDKFNTTYLGLRANF